MSKDYCVSLAKLLFPEWEYETTGASVPMDVKYYEAKYPPRSLPHGAAVTRLGPSPTGFIHLGNLFMATVNQKLASQSGGIFILRIEDTDQKREVEGAVPGLIDSLSYFGIRFDEGIMFEKRNDSDSIIASGDYEPYYQSERREIYRAFVRQLVLDGKAYPCFLTEDQINAIRAEQEKLKVLPGVYGSYAEWRGADIDDIAAKLRANEPYVVRFFADYENAIEDVKTITVRDGIRGDITMPKNVMDVVIMKKDGLPTYHFAHVIDDHLMRTTHVVRGEEWLSSLPVHIALFGALEFEPPFYCHTALLMKIDDGIKRKLSKRKDPELALSYYIADGYHPLAIREYLLTIINSNYEEWRLSNPDANNKDFILTTEKMGASGILFDLNKLHDVSRDTLAKIPAAELAEFMINWAARENPEAADVFIDNISLLTAALDVGRNGDKPRKDLCYARQIFEFISYFFDEFFEIEDPLPANIPAAEARGLLEGYLAEYDHADDRTEWFEKVRILAASHGYAPKPKDYKNSPDMYKGHVGDVSAVIRRALTGRLNAPDIYEIQQIIGEPCVRSRIAAAAIS